MTIYCDTEIFNSSVLHLKHRLVFNYNFNSVEIGVFQSRSLKKTTVSSAKPVISPGMGQSQTKTLACETLFGDATCHTLCRIQGKRKGHCNHRRICVCKPH
ncbi:uncharacterized protein [Leptinotarsa decemlineata]|uniref:uncharacterized protein n=1 Tax=Leptinotarsa decemlineata TaxID=7539 RepID=UPI003D307A96